MKVQARLLEEMWCFIGFEGGIGRKENRKACRLLPWVTAKVVSFTRRGTQKEGQVWI